MNIAEFIEIRGELIKVTLHYENGDQVLDGDDANKWMQLINSAFDIAAIHGYNPFATYKPEWQLIKK